MAPSSTWILSMKVLLISSVVASIGMVVNFSIPLMVNFAIYDLPAIWSAILSWLKPPYLYFVINGIIITIAASSRFHPKLHDDDDDQSRPTVQSIPYPPLHLPSEVRPLMIQPVFGVSESPGVLDVKPAMIGESENVIKEEGEEDEAEFVISRSTWTPPARMNSTEKQTEFASTVTEKPLVSSRFGHRKPTKASPEGGKALGVAKPRKQETLENTWRTITDGRHMPLTRHLRKSETWENHVGRQVAVSPQAANKPVMFKDRVTNPSSEASPAESPSPGLGKLRKEASLSQDELNRRVEAFIRKFNEEIRLQRQESLNQYVDMINRGAH